MIEESQSDGGEESQSNGGEESHGSGEESQSDGGSRDNVLITTTGAEVIDTVCPALETPGLAEGNIGDTEIAKCQSGFFEGK